MDNRRAEPRRWAIGGWAGKPRQEDDSGTRQTTDGRRERTTGTDDRRTAVEDDGQWWTTIGWKDDNRAVSPRSLRMG